jgi:hypothetical protein
MTQSYSVQIMKFQIILSPEGEKGRPEKKKNQFVQIMVVIAGDPDPIVHRGPSSHHKIILTGPEPLRIESTARIKKRLA